MLSNSSMFQLGRIRLLDVGSCFNPFLKFDEFLTVGIDIVPAVEVCVSLKLYETIDFVINLNGTIKWMLLLFPTLLFLKVG